MLSAVGANSTRVVHVGARAPVHLGYTCARGLGVELRLYSYKSNLNLIPGGRYATPLFGFKFRLVVVKLQDGETRYFFIDGDGCASCRRYYIKGVGKEILDTLHVRDADVKLGQA